MAAQMRDDSAIRSALFDRNQCAAGEAAYSFRLLAAAERLETNTSVGHMIVRPYVVLASRVYGSPSNGFWLAPFTFTDSPDHAGVSCTSAIAAAAHLAAARHLAQKESLFIDLFS